MDLPLLVVLWIQLFVPGARRNDCNVTLQSLVDFGKEAISGEFDPALGRVSDNVDFAELLRFNEQFIRHVI